MVVRDLPKRAQPVGSVRIIQRFQRAGQWLLALYFEMAIGDGPEQTPQNRQFDHCISHVFQTWLRQSSQLPIIRLFSKFNNDIKLQRLTCVA